MYTGRPERLIHYLFCHCRFCAGYIFLLQQTALSQKNGYRHLRTAHTLFITQNNENEKSDCQIICFFLGVMGQLFGRVIGADHLEGDKSFGPPFVGEKGQWLFFPGDGKKREEEKRF